MNLVIREDSWDMVDLTLTYKPAGESNYYVQAYAYNVTDEEVRGLEELKLVTLEALIQPRPIRNQNWLLLVKSRKLMKGGHCPPFFC